MTRTCISSSLIVFASNTTAAKNEKELLAVLKDVGAFISRKIDFETVEWEIKRQKALVPAHDFDYHSGREEL